MKSFILITLFFCLSQINAQSGWKEIYYYDFGAVPSKVVYLDQENIWGISVGAIFHSTTNGQLWSTQFKEDTCNFSDVYFVDEQNGWVVGWQEVYNTTDGGTTWKLQDLPNPYGMDVNAVFFLNPDTGWIAGSYRMIYVTYNGGADWYAQQPAQISGSIWLNDVHFWNPQVGCVVGGNLTGSQGVIYNSTDGGVTWNMILPANTGKFTTVQYITADSVWTADSKGHFYYSTDGGINWNYYTQIVVMGSPNIEDFRFFDNQEAIAIASLYQIVKTNNSWQNYDVTELGFFNPILGFSFNESKEGLAVGFGNVLRSNDGGDSWEQLNDKFNKIDFVNENTGYMTCFAPDTRLVKTTDGGYEWTDFNPPVSKPLVNLEFVNETTGFISTEDGNLLKTMDGCETWNELSLPVTNGIITKIQFKDTNTGFAITSESRLIKTTDGGTNWTVFDFDPQFFIYDIFFLDNLHGWVAGSDGFTAVSSDGGNSWDQAIVENTMPYKIGFRNENDGFFFSSNGDLYRSDDAGHSWEFAGFSTEYQPIALAFADEDHGWMVDQKWSYYTSDGGESWEPELLLENPQLWEYVYGFSFINPGAAFACTSGGRVYEFDEYVGLNENKEINALICKPNPANSYTVIYNPRGFSGKELLQVYSISGARINHIKYYYCGGNFVVDLSKLQKGAYLISIQKDKPMVVRVIKN